MSAFVPFVAKTSLPAAALNAALSAVEAEALAAAAAAKAEADSNASAIAVLQPEVAANMASAAKAEADAHAAASVAAAAVPASSVGQVGGPAGPLSSAGAVPLAQLGLRAGTGITIGTDGTIAASATSTAAAFDAYVVFQAYNVNSSGTNIGGGPIVLVSKGVSSVDSKGAGIYQINLSPAAPDANFIVSAFAKFDEAAVDGTIAIVSEPRATPGNPTSSPSFLQIVGSYQGSSTSTGTALFLYRIGIKFA